MVRKKVKLEYIENGKARRVTYKKRVKGLVKKTQELSVLCGVDVCAIIYGPHDQAPVVWPSDKVEATRIISKFKRKPEVDQSERQLNQQSFLQQSLNKAAEKLLNLKRRTRETEMENLITDLMTKKLTLEQVPNCDLGDLLRVINAKLTLIEHRINVNNVGHVATANTYQNVNGGGGSSNGVNDNVISDNHRST
ncbi:Agamous-like MADS-box protein AGL80 [Bienertia sinuspersici]